VTRGQNMRVRRRGAGLLALAVLVLPAGARADELLVMPYTCTMAGGLPVLTPGPERSHRIIGSRDQRKFNACSPVNRDMCRQWTVHRFDLDCDGTRASWVSVVAATNEGGRRAWLLDGRLVLRMGPRWSLPPDDPCAREADPDDRAGYRRMKRYCADQLALAPPAVVEMPFGYAPMLGIDGIFVKAAPGLSSGPAPLPPVAAAPPPAKSAAAEPLQELFPSEPPAEEPPREPAFREPPAKAAPPAVSQAAVPPPQPPPRVAGPPSAPAAPPSAEPPKAAPAAPATTLANAEAPKSAPAEAKPPAPNLGPRLIAPTPPPAKAAPAAPAAAPTAAANTGAGEVKPSTSGTTTAPKSETSAAPLKDAPKDASAPDDSTSGTSLLGVFRATTTGAIVAFTGLALGLLTAFALARRREHVEDARRRPRDLSAVSLDGRRRGPPARAVSARGHLAPNAAGSAPGRAPAQAATSGALTEWGDRMPRTRDEAFQVLGMGVAPSATEVAIKKIVDGLRQSWHPDLAKDEADRVLRELRCKQINVAWDLLRGQRAEV
jgi:hypothetical protein